MVCHGVLVQEPTTETVFEHRLWRWCSWLWELRKKKQRMEKLKNFIDKHCHLMEDLKGWKQRHLDVVKDLEQDDGAAGNMGWYIVEARHCRALRWGFQRVRTFLNILLDLLEIHISASEDKEKIKTEIRGLDAWTAKDLINICPEFSCFCKSWYLCQMLVFTTLFYFVCLNS